MSSRFQLFSTLSNVSYPFERIEEFSETGESLEVRLSGIENAKIKNGKYLWDRFSDFLPFSTMSESISLGEGNTALIRANKELESFTGIENLYLKNETQNPTWSFKDRGSLACIAMAKEMGETVTATISTGNMGSSISAYGAKSGIKVIVFVPEFAPREKIISMEIHGAHVIRIKNSEYSSMKKQVLSIANEMNIRVVTGNGPIRVEGYKMTAFEMYEQMSGNVPDYISVPTSACGHIRGIFKGYRELNAAGIIKKIPKMIIVQPQNNSPIVSALKQGKKQMIPFLNPSSVAKALMSGNPLGGDEIIQKADEFGWLFEDVNENDIVKSQQKLAESGYLVEPSSAVNLAAVKQLRNAGKIEKEASIIMILTGSGLKDADILMQKNTSVVETDFANIKNTLSGIL